MEERDTAWQEPGYDGLCNYAQKITSCFGLDGKAGGKQMKSREEEEGRERGCFFCCGAGCRNGRGCENVWDVLYERC